MDLKIKLKTIVKATFSSIGLDIIRRQNSPNMTLLGLRHLPFKTIVDVGANVGQFARKITSFFPEAKLYCFEPLPEPFEALCSWADTQMGRVIPLRFALGDKNGKTEFFFHEDHTPSSSFLNTTQLNEKIYPFTKKKKRIFVTQTTLDDVFVNLGFELFNDLLIKIDVQGFEDRVIAGGSKIFSRASACILEVTIDSLYESQAKFKDLVVMLDNLGYHYAGNMDQKYGDNGHCIFLDAVFLKRV
jgi:FkbM family methyltransferase